MLRPLPITIYGNCRYKRLSLGASAELAQMMNASSLITTICQQPPGAAIVHPHACLRVFW